ncbi:hypothetical protein CDL15_Pgr025057 [Punica granatum]|uniref:Uncharacterized protein n=1 Tax=Punica granatum TaxID=22663 RepID=A0A218W956_PUNGR|nr:hypothetical protein CDL15_Pgr025057 [Punica granatum]
MWKKKTKKKLRKGLVNCGRFPSDPMGEGGGQRQRFASCWTMEEEATAQAQVQKVSSAQLSSAQPRDVFLWLWGFSFVQLSLRSRNYSSAAKGTAGIATAAWLNIATSIETLLMLPIWEVDITIIVVAVTGIDAIALAKVGAAAAAANRGRSTSTIIGGWTGPLDGKMYAY